MMNRPNGTENTCIRHDPFIEHGLKEVARKINEDGQIQPKHIDAANLEMLHFDKGAGPIDDCHGDQEQAAECLRQDGKALPTEEKARRNHRNQNKNDANCLQQFPQKFPAPFQYEGQQQTAKFYYNIEMVERQICPPSQFSPFCQYLQEKCKGTKCDQ